jgi:phosphohistidine phosphatase SixA
MLEAIDQVAASTTVPAAETLEIVAGQGTLATDREAEGTLPTDQAGEMLAIGRGEEEIELDRGIFLAAAIEAGMHSEEVGVHLTDRKLVTSAIVVQRAWGPAEEAEEDSGAEEEVVAEVAEAGGDRQP